MKISIYKEPWNSSVSLMFWNERDGKVYAAKPVALEFEEAKDGMAPNGPTLRIPHMIGEDFLHALAQALDEKGIKTDKDAKIEGTLEATREHLKDLRQMLKLK